VSSGNMVKAIPKTPKTTDKIKNSFLMRLVLNARGRR
jgi:hypothetical protein